jgi:hypothetical protein
MGTAAWAWRPPCCVKQGHYRSDVGDDLVRSKMVGFEVRTDVCLRFALIVLRASEGDLIGLRYR